MKLSKAVGKNAHGQVASDVKLVQLALSAIKSCNKPYYKGKIDGKAGPQTICAIEGFQRDNKISVTGKIDTHGTTFNRLRQKTPMAMKNKLTKSGGGGTGAGCCLDNSKIKTNNDKVIAVMKKWPLPTGERNGLLAWVNKCTDAMIALTYAEPAVFINDEGKFVVTFSLTSWATGNGMGNHITAKAMVKKAASLIGGHRKWQQGMSDNLTFKSMTSYAILKNTGSLSPQDKAKIKFPSGAGLVHEKCAAAAVTKIKDNKSQTAREYKNDILATTIAVSEGVFDILAKNKADIDPDFAKGAKIVNAKFKTAEVLYTSGKILLQGNGKVKEKVVVGEVSSLMGGWIASAIGKGLVRTGVSFVFGAAGAALSAPALAAVAAAVGAGFTLLYIWYDMDKWIADNAPLWWEQLKEGTLLAYLKATKAVLKLKALLADWKDKVINSMTEFLFPKFETAYADYIEAYSKASIGDAMQIKDWINPFINKLLQAAGVPDFSKK